MPRQRHFFGLNHFHKSSSSGTTIYAYDGDNMVEQLNSSGTATARYTQGLGIDEPLEVYEGNKSYYYHADGLGSVVALTKSTGTAANTYFGYNTFGGMPAPSETVANPFRFTGREWDSETSLYYYRARYYDSLFGRFLSEDPLNLSEGMNFYEYVNNNPVLFNDPFGLWKNTGNPADPNKSTIVCNGRGGFRVHLAGYYTDLPELMACVGKCVINHEESHIRDVRATNPKLCGGLRDGIQVGYSNNKEQAASELAAYTLELGCLKKEKKKACSNCSKYIDNQIEAIVKHQLPKWRTELSPTIPKVEF